MLFRSLEFSDEAIKAVLDHLGCCIPHHVQLFFSHIRAHCLRTGRTLCSVDDVHEVYQKDMLSSRGHMELNHMAERLGKVLDQNRCAAAMDILTKAAMDGHISPTQATGICKRDDIPETECTQFTIAILDLLKHDGYLKKVPEGYVFISHLLRDWWRDRFGNFYTGE